MISIREKAFGLDIALYNEFTLSDFKQLEEKILEQEQNDNTVNILLNLAELRDFTVDMALEELRFIRKHESRIGKVAIIVEDVWIKLAARISALLTHSHIEYFDGTEEAENWLMSDEK